MFLSLNITVSDAAEKALIKRLTGSDEVAGRRCLSGLQMLIKQLTVADLLAESC